VGKSGRFPAATPFSTGGGGGFLRLPGGLQGAQRVVGGAFFFAQRYHRMALLNHRLPKFHLMVFYHEFFDK
jgi:hypothetical protein